MAEGETVCGILLAGGAGARFGGRKLLHPLPDGTPIGVAAWRHLHDALDNSLVVVRSQDQELAARFAVEGAPVLGCADAYLGMGYSLACGVGALAQARGWIIALGDMPSVQPGSIRALADCLRAGARIVVPMWNGQRGHPVGFAVSCRAELLSLTGDSGARTLLQRHALDVVQLALDDPGILQDVDTVEDAQRLRARDA